MFRTGKCSSSVGVLYSSLLYVTTHLKRSTVADTIRMISEINHQETLCISLVFVTSDTECCTKNERNGIACLKVGVWGKGEGLRRGTEIFLQKKEIGE